MPDLGKYADAVLSAYAVSLALLGLIVILSALRARRMAQRLKEAEARRQTQ